MSSLGSHAGGTASAAIGLVRPRVAASASCACVLKVHVAVLYVLETMDLRTMAKQDNRPIGKLAAPRTPPASPFDSWIGCAPNGR